MPLLPGVGIGNAAAFEQDPVKMRLDGTHRQPFAVGALVGVVEMGAAIEKVAFSPIAPVSHRLQAVDGGHQQSGTVAHGRVHHLPLPGFSGFEQGGQQTDEQQHGAAAIVGDQVQRWRRPAVRAADGVQRAGQGQIIDIVTGGLRQWPGLTPTGHATVDQSRVPGQAELRSQAQPLHDAGPKALDQHVGALDQA